MRFPRLVIPLSVALHAFFNLGLNLIVVFIFILASGDRAARRVARAGAAARCCSCLLRRAWRCWCPPCTCATATCSRSGRWRCRCSSTPRRSSTWPRPIPDSVEQHGDGRTRSRRSSPRPATCSSTRTRRRSAEAIGGTAWLLVPLAVIVRGHAARILGVHARGAADRRGALGRDRSAIVAAMATEPSAEVDELRRRVAELERELAEQTARANAAVAAAEDRSYWLDRMRIDLNAVMRNPARAAPCFSAGAVRRARLARRELAAPLTWLSTVSVVIPVKDGEERLEEVLAAVRAQGDLELIVIDSGSRDRSREMRAFGGRGADRDRARGVRPRPHPQPRRRARRGRADLLPHPGRRAARAGWLDAYREAFALDERVGAAFGPHLPFPGTSPMIARELTEFFAGFAPDGRPGAAARRRPALPLERERVLRARVLGGAALPGRGVRRGPGLRARACWTPAGRRSSTQEPRCATRTTTGRSSSRSATSTSTAACARRAGHVEALRPADALRETVRDQRWMRDQGCRPRAARARWLPRSVAPPRGAPDRRRRLGSRAERLPGAGAARALARAARRRRRPAGRAAQGAGRTPTRRSSR